MHSTCTVQTGCVPLNRGYQVHVVRIVQYLRTVPQAYHNTFYRYKHHEINLSHISSLLTPLIRIVVMVVASLSRLTFTNNLQPYYNSSTLGNRSNRYKTHLFFFFSPLFLLITTTYRLLLFYRYKRYSWRFRSCHM